MAVTVTTTRGWTSRLGDSIKGVLAGLFVFLLGFPLLFWNEGNAVKTRKALEEGEKSCISLDTNAAVDEDMNGRFVHLTGRADTSETLADAEFAIAPVAIRLERKVEMFQWQETSRSTTKKNLGGSETTTTTYDYRKVWSQDTIDSGSFHEAGHDNPGAKPFEDARQEASLVTFGAFTLAPWQISEIGQAQTYQFGADYACPIPGARVQGSKIYIPRNMNAPAGAQPQIGDVRVEFFVVKPHDISIAAVQKGPRFAKYIAKNGKKIALLADGIKEADEMFADAQSANDLLCWILRFVGFFMMFGGLKAALKPLSVLADVLPFLGDLVELGAGLAAFAVAAPCALVTIAIAWLFYRPVAAVALILAACAIVWLVKTRRKPAPAA